MAAGCLVLIGKIGFLQFVQGKELQSRAIQQQTRDEIITSKRGTIYDRNMKELAVSASVDTVIVNPTVVQKEKKTDEVCDILSRVLEMEPEKVRKILNKKTGYEYVKRKIESDAAKKVRQYIAEDKLPGVSVIEDSKRYYPYNNFAAHILGYTGSDNQGLSGLELEYDSYLTGESGRVITAKNAIGNDMPYEYEQYYSSKDGCSLVTTIDEVIQHYVENELETAITENKVENGACAIVMDVKNGDILAMATKPDFDPNNYLEITNETTLEYLDTIADKDEYNKAVADARNKMWRNKAIVDTYEPGSTFKIITSSIAVEENLVHDNDSFYCSGSTKVAGTTIRCWKAAGHGAQNFAQAIQNSCNPAFIAIGERVGKDRFFKYAKGFGLLEKTGIDVPGEAVGIFFNKNAYGPVENATTSFGQGFQITPIQLVAAVSAVANDGKYIRPHLVKEIVDADGNVVKKFDGECVRQIVSKETSEKIRGLLEEAVSVGSGKNAYIKGYRIGGKTGTSEKQPRSLNKKIASMIAFAPADDPKVAVLVMLDEPEGGQYFGGVIAAPVVGKIMENTLSYLGVEKVLSEDEQESEVLVPNLLGKTVDEAKKELADLGFRYDLSGNGEKIVKQVPQSGIRLSKGTSVILYTSETQATQVVVPSVENMTILQANNAITSAGLNMKISGAGVGSSEGGATAAAKQDPAAGTQVEKGSVVYVEFRHLDVE